MSVMSMPRAATSVATSTLDAPSRKRRSASSRSTWLRSPCSTSGQPRLSLEQRLYTPVKFVSRTAAIVFVGQLLPVVEVVVGLALVVGLLTRTMAVVSAVLFVAFIIAIASAWARGLTIDCGCFGGGGYDPDAAEKYPWEIARDVALLAGSVFVAAFGHRSRWALDHVLFRRTPLES